MSDGNGELPEGWAFAKLNELAAPEPNSMTDGPFGSKLKTAHYVGSGVRVIRLGNIGVGQFQDSVKAFVTPEHFETIRKHEIFPGDLVIAALAEPVGRACAVPEYVGKAIVKADCIRFKPAETISSPFLMNWLNSPVATKSAEGMCHGIGRLRINMANMRELPIPVPPEAEQRRIVSKIESLQERSSRARQALAEVGPLLEQFRQSVLRAAFSGRLTADWRAANPDVEPATELLTRIRTERRHHWEQSELAKYEAKGKQPPKGWQDKYKEPEAISEGECSDLSALPDGWCWIRFADICTVQGGFAFKSKDYTDDGVPLIRIGDLNDGAVTIDESTARLPSDFLEQQPQFLLNSGDVLIAMSGATTGKMAVFDCNEGALLNQRVGRFLPHAAEVIHAPYLRGLVENIVGDIRSRAYGGAQPNISPTEIASTVVAFPPRSEQVQIAELLRDSRSAVSAVENECVESESALTQLDQSILAKAFRGELVPQDPRDEPVSELLKRIRTTREATAAKSAKKKTTRKKPTKKARA